MEYSLHGLQTIISLRRSYLKRKDPMKKLLLLTLLCLPLLAYSQKKSKADRKIELEKQHERMAKILEDRAFALDPTLWEGRADVSFVAVIDSAGVIQSKSRTFLDVGIGNPTRSVVEGKVSRFEIIDRGVGKGFQVNFTFFGNFSSDVSINVDDDGFAIANLRAIKGSGFKRIRGYLVPLEESRMYVQNLEGW